MSRSLTHDRSFAGPRGAAVAVLITALASGVAALFAGLVSPVNLAMIYLIGVTAVSTICSLWNGVLASVLSVVVFDVAFVHPTGTLAVGDIEYVFTFAVMLLVSVVINTLVARSRTQGLRAHTSELHAEIERLRTDLLSSVSHDLRTPLASISGSASALAATEPLSAQGQDLVGTIVEQSERMDRLIRNLLDMSRIQGLPKLDLEWHDLSDLISNAAARTEAAFAVPVQVQIDPNLDPILVDGVLIEQVLVNALENSARYAGTDAEVVVRAALCDGSAVIDIIDDGPGIKPGSEESVFERFVTSGSGTGLGLAICRAAVKAHSGIMQFVPAPKGAHLQIVLPIGKVSG